MSRKLPIDVMISSTSKDLPVHRAGAIRSVRRAGFRAVVMEDLTAGPRDAIQASLQMVDDAEIYVGIFGKRYGYVPDDTRNPDKISITEMELRHAEKRGIPVLCFVMGKGHPGPNVGEEDIFYEQTESGKTKLAELVEDITDRYIVNFFKDETELELQILTALRDDKNIELAKQFLPPQYQGEIEDQPRKRDAIPQLGEFYTRPAYAGGMGFVGRADELQLLDDWAKDTTKPVMVVEAIGGQGKSALTWHWTNQNLGQFDGVVWWSFYTQGTTMTDFLRHTLAYISETPLADVTRYDYEARTELLALLRQGNYLLVLDGLERVLTAYHRLDAAAIRDDEVKESRDARAATNPKDTETLAQLLTCGSSKVLASTRLLPRAWENTFEMPHENVDHIKLEGLSAPDTLALAAQAQINVQNERRVTDFLGRFGYHPLVVGAILGLIGGRKNRRYRRSFDKWLDANERTFSMKNLDLRQRQTHIVGHVISGLTADARELLARLALFRDAVPYDAMTGLGVTEDEAAVDGLLLELESTGILMYDPAADEHDLHPVVRGYSQDLLTGEARRAAFSRLVDYFAAQPREKYSEVTTVEQLSRSIEVVRALQGAGRLGAALEVFKGLVRTLFLSLGTYDLMRTLLLPFFPDGDITRPPLLDKPRDQSWIINTMALALHNAGDPTAAVPLVLAKLKLNISDNNTSALATGLRNAAEALREGGRPAPARRFYGTGLRVALATDKQVNVARFNVMIGAVGRGDWSAALAQYNILFDQDGEVYSGMRYRAEMAAARDEDGAPDFLRRALDLNRRGRYVRYIMEVHTTWALYALAHDDPTEANTHAEEAVNLARRTNSGMLGATLAVLAQVRAAQGHFAAARDLLGQAERAVCAPAYQPDRELGVAWVHYLAGEQKQAEEHAKKAYKLAWADGESDHPDHAPGYTFWWALQRSKTLLAALGVDPPKLPMFDPATDGALDIEGFEGLEDEIEAYIRELEVKAEERKRRREERWHRREAADNDEGDS